MIHHSWLSYVVVSLRRLKLEIFNVKGIRVVFPFLPINLGVKGIRDRFRILRDFVVKILISILFIF